MSDLSSHERFMEDFHAAGLEIIDLSSVLGSETFCYPTDPQFKKSWHQRMPEAAANVSAIETGLHAGTHVDVPLHFLENGLDVCGMPITCFMGTGVAIGAIKEPGQDIVPEDLDGQDVRKGDMVFFFTGWESKNNTPHFYDPGWPGFSPEVVDMLLDIDVRAVGFDSPAADNCNGEKNGFPAHKRLLAAGIPIYESLINLDRLLGKRFLFIGLPLRLENAEASLVRAVAVL